MHHFPEAHTGENLVSELESVLESWEVPVAKVRAATTDNAANIELTIEKTVLDHFRCFIVIACTWLSNIQHSTGIEFTRRLNLDWNPYLCKSANPDRKSDSLIHVVSTK